MKKFSIILLIVFALFSCENGLIIIVPASSSFDFTMPSAQINADPDNIVSVSQVVDVSTFFTEDSEQIESIKLDKMVYEVSNYNNTSGDLVLMDLLIQTELDGTTTDILVITGLVVENTGEILAFEDGNPNSALSAAQVASLESIMDNVAPFNLIVTADCTQAVDGDFDVRVAWDISASVAQPADDGG